jgi:hypothetical protein
MKMRLFESCQADTMFPCCQLAARKERLEGGTAAETLCRFSQHANRVHTIEVFERRAAAALRVLSSRSLQHGMLVCRSNAAMSTVVVLGCVLAFLPSMHAQTSAAPSQKPCLQIFASLRIP